MRSLPPFIKILPFVIVGILLGQVVTLRWWVAAIGGAICSLAAYTLRTRREGSLYIAAAILLWTLATSALRTPQSVPPPTAPLNYHATITSYPTTSGRWQRCDATLRLNDKSEKIILRADTSITLAIGERGVVSGYLNPLPEGSYGSLMGRRGYVGELWATTRADWRPTAEEPKQGLAILGRRMQHKMVERIERLHLRESEEAIVEAMLTGWRGEITPSLRESYSRAGTSHLLAISGLHIGLVAMAVWWLGWLLPLTSRRGHIVRNITATLILILYAFISGLSPSAVRATIIFCTAQMALAYGTSKSSLNLLAGAASVMLLVNPNNLFDISFQLSFAAVVGIAIGYEPLAEFFGAGSTKRWLKTLLGVVIVGLCSTIATLPLVAHTFSVVSLVGIFLNPFVILTAEIIVLLGLIWVTLPLEVLQPIMSTLIGGTATLQNRLVEGAAAPPWSALEVQMPAWMVALCYLLMAGGVVVASLRKDKKEWKVRS